LGIDHAMAHTLSAHYDTPHGVACAMLLPISLEFNKEVDGERLRDIGRAMGVKGIDEMPLEEAQNAAIEAVKKLSEDVGIPKTLDKIKEEDLDQIAQDALNDACYPGNPREATLEQVKDMFRKLMA
jgi:lactaldehyde reductase